MRNAVRPKINDIKGIYRIEGIIHPTKENILLIPSYTSEGTLNEPVSGRESIIDRVAFVMLSRILSITHYHPRVYMKVFCGTYELRM